MTEGSHMYARTYLQGSPCHFLRDMDEKEQISQKEEEKKMLENMSAGSIIARKMYYLLISSIPVLAIGGTAMACGLIISPMVGALGGLAAGIGTFIYSKTYANQDGLFLYERQVRLLLKLDEIENLKKIISSSDVINQLNAVGWGFRRRIFLLMEFSITHRIKEITNTGYNGNQKQIVYEKLPPHKWERYLTPV